MYAIVWRYRVRVERCGEFERAYGAKGDWVRFFMQGEGYVRTQLYREVGAGNCFLTVDEWRSKAKYDAFRAAHAREYGEIDRRCENYTENEEWLGAPER
jgi:heme-degrading monooxygenase HmoA